MLLNVNNKIRQRNQRSARINQLKEKIMFLKNETAISYAKGQTDLYELKKTELDNLNAELNLLELIQNYDSFQNVKHESDSKPGILFRIVYFIFCLWLFGRYL